MTELDQKIREEFPVLKNSELVYLDNGATSQRPQCVIDAVSAFYETKNANPMRGLYELSYAATEAFEEGRTLAAEFIGAKEPETLIFTRNATESLNLVSYSYAESVLKEGDEIIVSIAEHHSNFLPWKRVAEPCPVRAECRECVFLPQCTEFDRCPNRMEWDQCYRQEQRKLRWKEKQKGTPG